MKCIRTSATEADNGYIVECCKYFGGDTEMQENITVYCAYDEILYDHSHRCVVIPDVGTFRKI